MTIKQWFYKHVNVTFVLLFLIGLIFAGLTLTAIESGAWIVAGLRFIFTLVMVGIISRWWEEHQ